MFIDILILLGGLVLIIVGANLLTDGSVMVARKFKVSELLIGLTVIAIGTSTPELVVSITSALKGSSDMAVGNVLGSNIFNSLVIIGVTALIRPIRLSKENTFRNIPLGIATSVAFVIITSSVLGISFMPNTITRIEGIVLLAGFTAFILYTINISSKKGVKKSKFGEDITSEVKESDAYRSKRQIMAIPMILAGLAGLVYGGELFLESAVKIAKTLGVSEFIISVTLMAGGTSLPELASCVVAARKGRSQMALGNVIGSNITNILLVLGGAATVMPLSLAGVTIVDVALLVLSSILLFATPFSFKKGQIDRTEATLFILVYLGYVAYMIFRS